MQRVYFYSDESKDSARVVVAGVAIADHANVIRKKLLRAEEVSGKGAKDWHSTKEPKVRRRYIQEVLNISQLQGRAFRGVYPNPTNPFEAATKVLEKAALRFGTDRRCVLVHEGFTRATRAKMKRLLQGTGQIEVEAGSLENEPRVRLADALAGFCRLVESDSAQRDAFTGLPYAGWFVDLA